MNTKTLFRIFLTTGFILWVLSWIGDSKGILPASTFGMILSVISTGMGIYFWLKSYKEKRGFYPNFFKIYRHLINEMKKNPFNGFFIMVRHLLKFYTLILVFSMVLVFIGFITIGQSEPVKTVQNYCENNAEINDITGKINHYGILRNVSSQWNSETGSSELSLVFVSENGVFNVYSKLEKENGEWKVNELELKDKNTGANTVYN
ncbi:hypothetical protein [Polaribacter cellanae]|uniref:Uncharacterized protein n=1 Tax=Polaribacter cellanae TaxID=2818493 RepID=A0A975CM89_9FLAO|nr:hypothetical protein [Polaribacter cellanae]QTE21805.1 hypothetical protein J3359_13410 [Polaribacter cellanae]